MKDLQFVPFTSALSTPFWHKFAELKLNHYHLNDDPVPIVGQTFHLSTDNQGDGGKIVVLPGLSITEESITCERFDGSNGQISGLFVNKNTAEGFRNIDKKDYLAQQGEEIWSCVISEEARNCPEKSLKFSVVAFSDLKKFHFYHWMVVPAPIYPANIRLTSSEQLSALLPKEKLDMVAEQLRSKRPGLYFLISEISTAPVIHNFVSLPQLLSENKEIAIGLRDLSSIDDSPSWPARNLLAIIAYHFPQLCKALKLLCWRDFGHENQSQLLTLDLSEERPSEVPSFVGWEKNARGKFGPNMTNLSASMDPLKLAESAVSLNLKLMKWRLMPDIDLELLEKTKCLLLGAGTLGCGVARNLQAWGFKKITLVDSGKVSYSNPVRQSLFTFEDCKAQKKKALAAADALKRIFPGTDAEGIVMEIPMPGHSIQPAAEQEVKAAISRLESLYDEHDVVFLLLDSREARWLPTLFGACKKKIVINAGLGFDSYLVMRHGLKMSPPSSQPISEVAQLTGAVRGRRLGCYFCNDVVAPGDSMHDRTLDQQCTVTRPGVSMIASALAVELLVSGLQHPDQFDAPAAVSRDSDAGEGPLGLVPHSIRGYLSRHTILLPATEAFSKCTACSDLVTEKYRTDGFDFLRNVFNDPMHLEALTGLDKLKDLSGFEEVLELSDSETNFEIWTRPLSAGTLFAHKARVLKPVMYNIRECPI